MSFGKSDVFASAVGGVKVGEPSADLGLALALASSVSDRPLDSGLVACGEIGLAGELRQTAQLERRLAEAARVGFTSAIIPTGAPPTPDGMVALRAATVSEALALTGLLGSLPASTSAGGPAGDTSTTPAGHPHHLTLLSESESRAAADW
jgi:DNA repair protein RadA/Sms